MNKDQVKGRAKEVSGKIQESYANLVDDEKMKIKGKIKKNAGKLQAAYGDAQSDIKENS